MKALGVLLRCWVISACTCVWLKLAGEQFIFSFSSTPIIEVALAKFPLFFVVSPSHTQARCKCYSQLCLGKGQFLKLLCPLPYDFPGTSSFNPEFWTILLKHILHFIFRVTLLSLSLVMGDIHWVSSRDSSLSCLVIVHVRVYCPDVILLT